jgi:hypothetical protein
MKLLLRWSAIRATVLFKAIAKTASCYKACKGEEHIITYRFVEELLTNPTYD